MAATLRFNPDKSEFEAELPDGSQFQEDWPDDGVAILAPDDGDAFMVVLEGSDTGLEANKLYKLVPVGTIVERDVELDDDEEDAESEDEDDEETPVEVN